MFVLPTLHGKKLRLKESVRLQSSAKKTSQRRMLDDELRADAWLAEASSSTSEGKRKGAQAPFSYLLVSHGIGRLRAMMVSASIGRGIRLTAFLLGVSMNGRRTATMSRTRKMNLSMILNLLDLFRVSVSITAQDSGYCVNKS